MFAVRSAIKTDWFNFDQNVGTNQVVSPLDLDPEGFGLDPCRGQVWPHPLVGLAEQGLGLRAQVHQGRVDVAVNDRQRAFDAPLKRQINGGLSKNNE